jgi:antitoxin MazE
MTVKLVQIGNSKGVRIPKALLEQAGLEGEVDLRLDGRQIVIGPKVEREPRAGWVEAFERAIAKHGNALTEEDRQWLDAPLSRSADEDSTW